MTVTKEELAEYCNLPAVPSGAKGVEFVRFLEGAKGHVASRTGRADGTVTITATSRGGTTLMLPLAFATSIGPITSPSGQVITPSRIDQLAGIVYLPAGEAGVWTAQFVGAGLPADLELAVLEIGKHLYGSQRITTGGRPGAAATPTTGPAFSIPNRAIELMGPYLLPAIA